MTLLLREPIRANAAVAAFCFSAVDVDSDGVDRMQMTARGIVAPWLAVRRVPMGGSVAAAVLAVRGWRARERAVRRGRQNGDRSEVVARLRVLLERDSTR